MLRKFENDENGYLAWVQGHPDGYIVNIDDPQVTPQYPMVHAASHKSLSSSARTNYTTGRYFKVCSERLEELEVWAQKKYG
jgi:hypothetical protein